MHCLLDCPSGRLCVLDSSVDPHVQHNGAGNPSIVGDSVARKDGRALRRQTRRGLLGERRGRARIGSNEGVSGESGFWPGTETLELIDPVSTY